MSRDAILFAIMCAIGAISYYLGRLSIHDEVIDTLIEINELRNVIYDLKVSQQSSFPVENEPARIRQARQV